MSENKTDYLEIKLPDAGIDRTPFIPPQINLTERSEAARVARAALPPQRLVLAYLEYWLALAGQCIATPANPYIEGSDLDPAFLAPQRLMLEALRDWATGKSDLPPGATWWLQAFVARREETLTAWADRGHLAEDPAWCWAVDELAAFEWLWAQVVQVQPVPDDIQAVSLHGYGGTL